MSHACIHVCIRNDTLYLHVNAKLRSSLAWILIGHLSSPVPYNISIGSREYDDYLQPSESHGNG